MKKFIYATALVILVTVSVVTYKAVYASPTSQENQKIESEEPAEQVEATPIIESSKTITQKSTSEVVQDIIREKSDKYNLSYSMMSKVIFCESGFQTTVSHDGGRGKGVTGFHRTTFNQWAKRYFKETNQTLNYDSAYDQIELMSWAFTKGENYRNDWTSYNKLVRYGECNNAKLQAMGITNINIQPN